MKQTFLSFVLLATLWPTPCSSEDLGEQEIQLTMKCDDGESESCDELIEMYRTKLVSTACIPTMIDLCEKGYSEACMVLYFAHADVESVGSIRYSGVQCARVLDRKKARYYLERTCQRGYAPACLQISSNYDNADSGHPADVEKSIFFHKLTCEYGDNFQCHHLGLHALNGKSPHWGKRKVDEREAFYYFSMGCEGGRNPCIGCVEGGKKPSTESCILAASMLENGHGVVQDLAETQRLYTTMCRDHNSGKACYRLGMFFTRTMKDPEKASQYLEKACSMGYAAEGDCPAQE